MSIRERAELEAGPLDMTDDEVRNYFPDALEAIPAMLKARKIGVDAKRRFQCDDIDLHVTFIVDAKRDKYANFSWRPSRKEWKFSF